jgi:DNA-binding NarL/FixJ family response regulator
MQAHGGEKTYGVALVHGLPVPARALCAMLELNPSVRSVTACASAESYRLQKADPDIVIVDKDDDIGALIPQIERIVNAVPRARICVLTSHTEALLAKRALRAGADAIVPKDLGADAFDASLTRLVENDIHADRAEPPESLSQREKQIAMLIAQGLSNRDIAVTLRLSEKTVKNHISSIFVKLNVKARTQVVIYALSRGWN